MQPQHDREDAIFVAIITGGQVTVEVAEPDQGPQESNLLQSPLETNSLP
ncbi:MAG: hypothetical protein JWM57_5 [Phycisphaerales bacterium]|nr:hypothetical protein [Phycisphaerales bacterium]